VTLFDLSRSKRSYSLTLPVPPSVNNYYKRGGHSVYLSQSVLNYRLQVMAICVEQQITPLEGDVYCSIFVYRPAQRGDIDNYLKGLFDALNGWAWVDDSQIKAMDVGIGYDRKNPRLEIDVWTK